MASGLNATFCSQGVLNLQRFYVQSCTQCDCLPANEDKNQRGNA